MKRLRQRTRPIPVRLNDEILDRLEVAARRMGATKSATIRFAILNQLPHIEAGRITLAA